MTSKLISQWAVKQTVWATFTTTAPKANILTGQEAGPAHTSEDFDLWDAFTERRVVSAKVMTIKDWGSPFLCSFNALCSLSSYLPLFSASVTVCILVSYWFACSYLYVKKLYPVIGHICDLRKDPLLRKCFEMEGSDLPYIGNALSWFLTDNVWFP